MARQINNILQKVRNSELFKRYIKFRSSIYGRVVFIIVGSLIILFVIFNVVFRTVYVDFFNNNIRQSGDNISSIVEGALYYSMLENDKGMLQQTLSVISTMSGIDEVNMYNDQDSLAFSSFSNEERNKGNPNCKQCHSDLVQMFPPTEKAYRIIGYTEDCGLFQNDDSKRHLLIRKPILNERSCYTAECHAHLESDIVLGSLIITLPLDNLDAFVKESSSDFLFIATLITIMLLTFLIIFTMKKIKDPLDSIIIASEAVSKGDNNIRLDIKPNLLEDMRKVSMAFNNMLDNIDSATNELQNWSQQLEYKVRKKTEELLEAQNELIHVERIASLGKLSSSVAHELNNPLSGILIYTKLIYKLLNNSELQFVKKESILSHLKLIETETKRCGDIVKGLLDFSRKDQDNFEVKNIHELLNATSALMTHSIKIANINLLIDFTAERDQVYCNQNQIKQAFVALLVNATEAIQEYGEITIRTSNPNQDTIKVEITDTGTGISPDDISHIFEPFFSTKRDTSGIGLGLAIVHGIVETHKGKIEVNSILGKGTMMSIIFPLVGTKE